MLIQRKRIRKLALYTPGIQPGTKLVVAAEPMPGSEVTFKGLGFTEDLISGETLLPAASFGPVSRFNAEGKEKVHRDQEMETAHRMIQWHWTEWHGRDKVEKSDTKDISYLRYPRTFIPPPSVEIILATRREGGTMAVVPALSLEPQNEVELLHRINLFLEIFGSCQLLTEDLNGAVPTPTKKLNWRLLPPGQHPWERLKREIDPLIQSAPKGDKGMMEYRTKRLHSYGPDFTATGTEGFQGYVAFGYTTKGIYLLESMYYGNATYVFGEQWEALSKLTKAEIISKGLHKDRIVHLKAWDDRIDQLLK